MHSDTDSNEWSLKSRPPSCDCVPDFSMRDSTASPVSGLVARVHAVELAQEGGPFHDAVGAAGLRLVVHVGLLEDRVGHVDQLGAGGHGGELRARGELQA